VLYLALFLPQLSLEACAAESSNPAAVVDRRGTRRWIVGCNDAARAAGVRAGLEATMALAICPELQFLDRSPGNETQALRSLAAWAGQFSSWICFDRGRQLLWMEVGSSLKYFGGVERLLARVEDQLPELGHVADIGIAPTLEAAALFARSGQAAVREVGDLLPALAPLPLAELELDEDLKEILPDLGIRTVAELLALDRKSLARRFGAAALEYLDRLLGHIPDPRPNYRLPPRYSRRFELLGAVENVEGLLFPLRRMLVALQGYLVGRDSAVQEIDLRLQHEGTPPTLLKVRSTRPVRDAARMLALVRERLERAELKSPVVELQLLAQRLVPIGDTQLELIEGGSGLQESSWDELLDRLRARLGPSAVRQLGLRSDHRPEHAWCLVEGQQSSGQERSPERPLWLVPPTPLEQLPPSLGRPERIEAGWACGRDERRDYYIAEAPGGSRLWIFRDANLDRWFLQGLWA